MFKFGGGRKRWFLVAAGLVCAAVVGVVLVFRRRGVLPEPPPSGPRSFDGPSTSLRQTIVVPALDSPIPEGKSALWCASFQLAWDRLMKDVAKGPVEVQNAETVARRLNGAAYPEASLDPK